MKKIAIVFLIMTGFFLTGCKKSKLDKVVIAEVTHSLFYAPQYVAASEKIFEKYNIEVEFVLTPGADKVMAALISKDVNIGLMGPEASVYVYNQGRDDYAINFAQLTQKDGSFLVGRKAEPNFKMQNLTSAEIIGGRKGGMPEMTLEYVMKSLGLDIKRNDDKADINVRTDIEFAAMAGAFTRGEGDYVALFEPTATKLENDGLGHIVASIGELAGELPYTCYSATKSFLEKNDDLVERFTKAIYEAQTWVYEHTDEEVANAVLNYFKDTSYNDIVKVIKRYRSIEAYAKIPLLSESALDKLQDIMIMAGEINTKVPYEKIVTKNYANKAVS